MDRLDLYDKKILYELDMNARVSASSIARKIKLPKETVNYRIKRLITKRYIKYFYTIINASLLGYKYCKVFLKLHRVTPAIKKEILTYLQNQPNCANLRVVEGSYDLVFIAMYRTPKELDTLMRNYASQFGPYTLKKNIHTIITMHKISQKIFLDKQTLRKSFHPGEPQQKEIDEIDLKILDVIARQARTKLFTIANMIQQKSQTVRYRVKKLENDGIIVSYSTAINHKKLLREYVQLNLSLSDHTKITSIIEFFDAYSTCSFAYELLGEYDLSLEIYVNNYDHLRRIMNEFKEKFAQHYISYDLAPIFQEYVINWLPGKSHIPLPALSPVLS